MTKPKFFLAAIFLTLIAFSNALAAPPVVQILFPADGKQYDLGDSVTFTGTATDPEDGVLTETALSWSSSKNGALGSGPTVTISNLREGDHEIILTATDNDGEIAQDVISITVTNPAPQVTITSPADLAEYTANDTISFIGNGYDAQDGNLSGTMLQWSSDKDGSIGTGKNFTSSNLSIGTHIITLRATDSAGASSDATITITIINTKPVAEILSPYNNSIYTSRDTISFQGRGVDNEDGSITDSTLRWSSSIDGEFGTGPEVYISELSPGNHIISLTVKDSNALISDPAEITIEITNEGPVPVIATPVQDRVFNEGESIILSGSAQDKEDGAITGTGLEWSSDLDGFLGTGTEIKNPQLRSGRHTITLTATDNDGFTNSVSVSIVTGNKYPVPEIVSPENNQVFLEGEDIEFSGKASDFEDGTITGTNLIWLSSRDDEIGRGPTLFNPQLSPGTHTITLKAVDSYGAYATAEIRITYGNIIPEAKILNPQNNAEYETGEDVILHGTGTDAEDGDLSGENLSWVSNQNGFLTNLGTGTSFKVNTLKSGTHTIILTATDSGNGQGTDQVTIIIKEMYPDKYTMNISEGSGGTFEITGGVPPFRAFSRRADIASAEIIERTVHVTGKKAGDSEIIVTDQQSINSFSVNIKVLELNLSIPSPSAFLSKDGTRTSIAYEGDNLVLDGSESTDSSGISSFKWHISNGNPPIYLTDNTSEKSSFVAPPVSGTQKYLASLTVKNRYQVESTTSFEFIIREKNDPFEGSSQGIVPLESGTENVFYGIKYTSGLSGLKSKIPGTDTRNRPENLLYNLVEVTRQLEENENTAQFIIYLPDQAKEEDKWYQENNYIGWQEMTASQTPLTNGAFFNQSRDQVFINIEDNGSYDLDPDDKKVKTVSGIGNNIKKNEPQPKTSGGSSGSCFIDSIF
ncbi:MAG: hypothetical protein H6680_05560 [Desulfobacteraceae bacterium]|nr:hypothetical protein [Desulfobacteraceae bacterium]